MDGVSVDDGKTTPRAGFCASGAGLRPYAVDFAADHPGDQPRPDGRRFPQRRRRRSPSLTSIYHFSFAASQIPVGAAMDRFGVRPVSLSLLIGTVVGAMASGFATGPESFMFGQFLLGVATSGMLMCPMTLGRQADCRRRALVSGRARSCRSAISACCCRRARWPLSSIISAGGPASGYRPASVSRWRSRCSRWYREQPAAHADASLAAFADGRCDASRPVASSSRPDRACRWCRWRLRWCCGDCGPARG